MTDGEAMARELESNPTDWVTRLVYADWLDENDRPEEADRQRRWREAYEWMCELARRAGTTNENYPAEGDRPISYDDLIRAGHDWVDHGEWFVQYGDETLRDEVRGAELSLYWEHWETLTGRHYQTHPSQADNWGDGRRLFSCSC